jgi:protein-S-isoprenylcysteine O-methyltransferase Ste14
MLISLCICAVIVAVLLDFLSYGPQKKTRKERRSVVATGTMSAFFVIVYLLIRFRVWTVSVPTGVRTGMLLVGTAIVVAGATVNILGRIALGKNWANHIKIYTHQTLVTTGPYRYVRHPLYASLIWMGFGTGIAYANAAAFLAVLCIFLPFMHYRAKQEEELLRKEFPAYEKYRRTTGTLFPRWR